MGYRKSYNARYYREIQISNLHFNTDAMLMLQTGVLLRFFWTVISETA